MDVFDVLKNTMFDYHQLWVGEFCKLNEVPLGGIAPAGVCRGSYKDFTLSLEADTLLLCGRSQNVMYFSDCEVRCQRRHNSLRGASAIHSFSVCLKRKRLDGWPWGTRVPIS